MNNVIYQKEQYVIIKADCGFIVYNTNKEFEVASTLLPHTHLKSFKRAKDIINLALHQRIPRDYDYYCLTSLQRIADSKEYIDKIQQLIQVKKSKTKQNYFNPQKGYHSV